MSAAESGTTTRATCGDTLCAYCYPAFKGDPLYERRSLNWGGEYGELGAVYSDGSQEPAPTPKPLTECPCTYHVNKRAEQQRKTDALAPSGVFTVDDAYEVALLLTEILGGLRRGH